MASPRAVAVGVVVSSGALYFAAQFRQKLKLLRRDANERHVTAADLRNPESSRVAQLPPLPSAKELVRECQEGKRSVLETLEEFLQRAQACSELTNCLVLAAQPIMERRARELASRLDTMPSKVRHKLPLFGLPFSVKECFLVEGTDSTVGLRALAGHPQSEDAVLVAQMIALGAVPFCKTNVPQIMYSWECANHVHGVTSHPLHRSFIPGGSSGGEAALIAAGGSIVGLGTDIGGSCRIPAHMSGCVGLKCTRGRISLQGKGPSLIYGEGQQIIASCTGLLANTASDLEYLLAALCSAEELQRVRYLRDSSVVPVPWNMEAKRDGKVQLTIGWYFNDGFIDASPACERAVREAVAALERSGARCIEFRPPYVAESFWTYVRLLVTGWPHIASLLVKDGECTADALTKNVISASMPALVRPLVARLMEMIGAPFIAKLVRCGGAKSGAEYYENVAAATRFRVEFAKSFSPDIDLLLAPVHVLPAHPHMTSKGIVPTVSYSCVYNLLDYPAGVVPVTTLKSTDVWTAPKQDKILDGEIRSAYDQALAAEKPFPVGVQIVGRPFAEETVLRGMLQLEAALKAFSSS